MGSYLVSTGRILLWAGLVIGIWLGLVYKVNSKAEDQLHFHEYVKKNADVLMAANDLVQVLHVYLLYGVDRIGTSKDAKYVAMPPTMALIGFPQYVMSSFDKWHGSLQNDLLQIAMQPVFVVVYAFCHILLFLLEFIIAITTLTILAVDSCLHYVFGLDPSGMLSAPLPAIIFALHVLLQLISIAAPWFIYRYAQLFAAKLVRRRQAAKKRKLAAAEGMGNSAKGAAPDTLAPPREPVPVAVDEMPPLMRMY
jgi:hypothetical protein